MRRDPAAYGLAFSARTGETMNLIASHGALRAIRRSTVAAIITCLVLSPTSARPHAREQTTQPPATAKGPLVIAKQSFFYIGGHYDQTHPDHHVVGQVYV